MKEKILKALRETKEEYVSGSVLCEEFGVSRQAVWKNITALKEVGYDIISVPKKGYRLLSSPDKLYGPDICSRLKLDSFCKKVECFEVIDSTNTRAKQMAELGEEEGTLLVAEEQTAGKGRRGRVWKEDAGQGICMTLLLRPALPPDKISGLTLLSALALAKAVKEECHVPAQIKWPNDVIIAKKKICGILTEMSSEENFVHYVVVGIGINANVPSFEEELKDKATSIYLETGKKVDRCALVAKFVSYFEGYYKQYEAHGDLSGFVESYNELMANKDREVCVYYGMIEQALPENTDKGVARGIDKDGALLVEIDGKVKRIVSGEVSVRGLYGYV